MQRTSISDSRRRTQTRKLHDRRNRKKTGTATKTENESPQTFGSPYLLKKIRPKKNEETRSVSRKDFLTVRNDLINYIKKKNLSKKNIPDKLCPEFFEMVSEKLSFEIYPNNKTSIVRINDRPYLKIVMPLTFYDYDVSCEIDIDGIQYIFDNDLKNAAHAALAALLKHTPVCDINNTVWYALAESSEIDTNAISDEYAEEYAEISENIPEILQSSKTFSEYEKQNIKDAYLAQKQLEEILDKCLGKNLPREEHELAEFLKNNINALYTEVFMIEDDMGYSNSSVTINGYDHFPLMMGCKCSPISTGIHITEIIYEGDVEEIPLYGEFTLKEDSSLQEDTNEMNFLAVINELNRKFKKLKCNEHGNNNTDMQ